MTEEQIPSAEDILNRHMHGVIIPTGVAKVALLAAIEEYASLKTKALQEEIEAMTKERDYWRTGNDIKQLSLIEAKKALEFTEQSNKELLEALKGAVELIEWIISGKRVVNLDEAIAYYKSLLPKEEKK